MVANYAKLLTNEEGMKMKEGEQIQQLAKCFIPLDETELKRMPVHYRAKSFNLNRSFSKLSPFKIFLTKEDSLLPHDF